MATGAEWASNPICVLHEDSQQSYDEPNEKIPPGEPGGDDHPSWMDTMAADLGNEQMIMSKQCVVKSARMITT